MSLNIWSIDKHVSIKKLLIIIDEEINLSHFDVELNSAPTPQAIRLIEADTPGLAAYIFSYGQSENHYGIDLEYPILEKGQVVNPDSYEEKSIKQVIDLLKRHFNIL